MNVSSYLVATSSSTASSPIASKSLGMCGASVKPGSRMYLEASSFDAASASQVRLKDAYLGGLKQQGTWRMRKTKKKKLMILNLSLGFTSLLLKPTKLVGEPFAGETAESISSAFQRRQQDSEATSCFIGWDLVFHRTRPFRKPNAPVLTRHPVCYICWSYMHTLPPET